VTGRRRDRALLAVVVVAHMLVLYWPRAGEGGVPHLDKVVHALVFGAVLWAGRRAGIADRWLVPLLLAHAVLSEVLQAWLLPGRSGDPADVVADVAGVALAMLLRPGTRRDRPRRLGASWRDERAGARGTGD